MAAIDLRLYHRTGQNDYLFTDSEKVASAVLSETPASGIEILGNKVVKYLKTTYGSDALNPTYGSRSLSASQMSQSYLPKFRLELEKDISRCTTYIKQAEARPTFTGDKLSKILLRDIVYNPYARPSRIDIFLEIITVQRTKALVALNAYIG